MSYPRSIQELKSYIQAIPYPPKGDPARDSVIQLISAVIELCNHIESAQESANYAQQAANTASCIANGIIPD